MNKKLLNDYIDACELVKETEIELERLEKGCNVEVDKVIGSMHDFPYVATSFKIEGAVETAVRKNEIEEQKQILRDRKRIAERIKTKVERCMNNAPVRMQRIISYRYFQGLSWDQIADRMGRNATGDSVRMELVRFLKK